MATNSTASLFTYSPSQVPIFEGEHYEYWSSQMQTFFTSLDLWEVIEDDEVVEDSTEGDEEDPKLRNI